MKLWQLIIMMSLVTYIPRMLPMVFLKDMHLPPFVGSFLKFIPYTALGALIFPSVLSSTGNIQSSLLGSMVAIILAFYRLNVIIVVFGGIIGVLISNLLIG